MDEIIKCLKCGHVLISGAGMIACFSPGTSIECRICGNKYEFGKDEKKKYIDNDLNTYELSMVEFDGKEWKLK